MDGCEYEHSTVPCDGDKCVLCKLSTRAHSWKTTGQAAWASTCQRGQKTFQDMFHVGGAEGTHRCDQRIPQMMTSLQNTTGRILTVCLSFCRSARPIIVKGVEHTIYFLIEHDTLNFLFVCILMLLGTLYSLFPSSYTSSQPVEFFLLILFTGSLFCWVAISWWAQQSLCRYEASTNQISESSPEVLLEKPPEYESLVPVISDVDLPAYEDVTSPDRDIPSRLGNCGAPPCPPRAWRAARSLPSKKEDLPSEDKYRYTGRRFPGSLCNTCGAPPSLPRTWPAERSRTTKKEDLPSEDKFRYTGRRSPCRIGKTCGVYPCPPRTWPADSFQSSKKEGYSKDKSQIQSSSRIGDTCGGNPCPPNILTADRPSQPSNKEINTKDKPQLIGYPCRYRAVCGFPCEPEYPPIPPTIAARSLYEEFQKKEIHGAPETNPRT